MTIDGITTRRKSIDGRRVSILSIESNRAHPAPEPPLVMLHGLGCSSRVWKRSMRLLSRQGCRRLILAPDLPGSGHSQSNKSAGSINGIADWLKRLLDSFSCERADFAANSFGCQIALAFADRYPQQARSLALLGPTTGDSQRSLAGYAWGLFRDSFGESMSYDLLLLRMFAQMGPIRYLGLTRAMMQEDTLWRARSIHCPVMVMRGGHDRIISEEMAMGLAEALPQGQYKALDSGAHAAEYNMPELFAAALNDFWNNGVNSDHANPDDSK